MLQALYSRSAASVQDHVNKVRETGSGKFMERFYVGYGHSSIADCGSTTVFCEGLSMLADKALQDWPLYSGQETSTRYVDMEKQAIIDPLGTSESGRILDEWMGFYKKSSEPVRAHLRSLYPRKEGEKEGVYEKAIAARSFDILRGFLPAGITTQLSWHTNLRQAHDKLALLRYHPLEEVSGLAQGIHAKLQKKYAHSFSHQETKDQEEYRRYLNDAYNYYDPPAAPQGFMARTNIREHELGEYQDLLEARPAKTGLPHFLSELGNITFEFLLDFGSFRDVQRHRNGVCRMPLLTTRNGFGPWYLEQLPKEVRQRAQELIREQSRAIEALEATDILKQYYVAMGFLVACKVSYGLPAAAYVMELRSGKPVHPTLRKVAHQMNGAMNEFFPSLPLYSDLDPDDWDVRRGEQDITERPTPSVPA